MPHGDGIAAARRKPERCIVLCIHLSAVLQQERYNGGLSFVSSLQKRFAVACAGLRTILQQQLHSICVSLSRGPHKRGAVCINTCTMPQQEG
mmetsp:Transcript_29888/g.66109  ORF Transcript_29888/g.66109 Transcript_29888/m.66109 type:complete len:92 (+) Transcript_29888:368-643(+)